MNIQEYIASGIIENYVLGATTASENAEVEQLATQYLEIAQEIEANRIALAEYIMEFRLDPPAELKNKVMQKLDFLYEEENLSEDKIAMESPEKELLIKPIYSNHQNLNTSKKHIFSLYPYLVAACLVLLLLSGFANVILYNRLLKTESELSSLVSQNQQLAKNFSTTKANYDMVNKEIAVLTDPNCKWIDLKGLKEFPTASVVLIWDLQSNDIYLQLKNLPPAPSGKQYQLWAIKGENVSDAGLVDKSAKHLYKMKNITEAEAFAITLEKEGGVTKAEGAMYVLGKVI